MFSLLFTVQLGTCWSAVRSVLFFSFLFFLFCGDWGDWREDLNPTWKAELSYFSIKKCWRSLLYIEKRQKKGKEWIHLMRLSALVQSSLLQVFSTLQVGPWDIDFPFDQRHVISLLTAVRICLSALLLCCIALVSSGLFCVCSLWVCEDINSMNMIFLLLFLFIYYARESGREILRPHWIFLLSDHTVHASSAAAAWEIRPFLSKMILLLLAGFVSLQCVHTQRDHLYLRM